MIVGEAPGLVVLGIDAENVRRLQDKQPIVKHMSVGTVVIYYAATLEDLQRELVEAFGSKDVRFIDTRKRASPGSIG